MGFIEDELEEVKKLCENVVTGSKLISCVPSMIRVEIKRTSFKTIIVCMQFPADYPKFPILIELKSKTISDKLLSGLSNICDNEAKKNINRAQILHVLKFIRNFIDENPLLCCYNEINELKKLIKEGDELKLKQKTSCVILKVINLKYFLNCKIDVADDYPTGGITVENIETNFSPTLHRHMVAQAKEIARRCIESPLKRKPKDPPFQPQPSLKKTLEFLIDCVKRLPSEHCQICNKLCFPADPSELEFDENSPKHIERVYCGHLFHLACFYKFMKTPPFGNKKCALCGHKIYHFKWSLSDKLAENRWAHEQARERELEEVVDFFK